MSGARARLAALPVALAALALAPACRSRPPAPILTWHEVGPDGPAAEGGDSWRVPQGAFLAQLDALAGAGRAAVPLRLLLDHLDQGAPLPPKAVALTFDDGTEDHYTRVLPALRAHKMVAAFFLSPARIAADEAHRVVERDAAGERRYLIWPEVLALRDAGMELGAHGLTHARLPDLGDDAALAELVQSRDQLAAHLGAAPELMAWPFNALRARHKDLAKQAGYRAAVAGVVHGSADRWALYRIPVTATTGPLELLDLLR